MSAINLSSNKINVVKVADGQNGQSGFTQVLLYLYQRAQEPPSKPATSSYNPTNGTLTASDSWVSSINLTQGDNPCYVITTFLSIPAGTSSAININQNQWAAPAIIFQNGQDGKGISSITEYYLANNDENTTPSYDDPNWSTIPTTATAVAKYVWNYELITYTSGQPMKSTPHVVGMYGAGGKGISSIVDYYAASPSTTPPADNQFSTQVPDLDQTNKYLWNYERITYTDNNHDDSSKRIIGMYSKDGTSVTVSQTYYGTTNSSSIQPGSGEWTQGSPTNIPTGVWVWIKTVFSDGNEAITCSYAGTNGQDGQDGTSVTITSTSHSGQITTVYFSDGTSIQITDGANGKEISTITEYYKKGSSDENPPTGTWSTDVVVPDEDYPYLWNYEVITYSNNTTSETSKRIIGTYSADGTDGKGISSITNYYKTTTNTTAPTTGWVTSPIPIPDQTNKYLWNYEHTVYTDNTSSDTTAHIIGMYGEKGDNGISVTGVVEQYAINNSDSTPPNESDWGTSLIAPTSTYRYLWNREVISYSSGDPTKTTPHIAGMYTEDGADGKGISSVTDYYKRTTTTTPPSKTDLDWVTSPIPVPDQTYKYLWNYEHTLYSDNTTSDTTPHIIGMYGEKGDTGNPGADGSTCATVQLYQRSAAGTPDTAPALPNGNVTYTFATGAVSGSLNNWTNYIPAGDTPCYMIIARVIQPAGTATDTIGSDEWSDPPVKIVENGAAGAKGYNTATVYLYKRGVPVSPAIRLAGPNNTLTYNFTNGQLTAADQSYFNGWQQTVPTSDGNPCWVTTAAAISQSDSVNITYNKWADSVILAEDGKNGVTITGTAIAYAQSSNGTTPPSSGWGSSIPTVTDQYYLWTRTTVSYSDSTPDTVSYSVSYKAKNGTNGQNGTSVTITSQSIQYKALSTGTGNPGSTGWSNQIPETSAETPYLWTKTVVNYSDNTSTTAYSVSRTGLDGTSVTITGTSSSGGITTVTFSDGNSITINDGKEISTVTEYYAVYDKDDVAPTSGWTTDLLAPTSSNPYLWNYEVIAYNKGSNTETSKRVIGTYSAPGTPGADGKGISSIVNYYKRTQNTTAPSTSDSGWVDCPPNTIPTTNETYRYLWNYERTTYTTGDFSDTTPHIISIYVVNGTNSITLSYYKRTTDNPPAVPTGTYNYNFTTNTFSGGDTISEWTKAFPTGTDPCWVTTISFVGKESTISGKSFTTPAVRLVSDGAQGIQGPQGPAGANGTSVSIYNQSITYHASNNGNTPPDDNNWSSTVEGAGAGVGDYLWTRTIVNYTTNGTTVSSTTTSYSVSRIGSNGADGQDGQNGQDGTSVSILNQGITYHASNNGNTPPSDNNWSSTVAGAGAQDGDFLWTRTIVNYTTDGTTISNSTTSYSVSRIGKNGTNGTNGQDGVNSAILYIYQRAATTPSAPQNDVVYVFADGDYTQATKGYLSPWQTSMPTNDGNPCYVATAAAISSSSTDTIHGTNAQNCDWTVSELVANGTNGTNGVSITGIVEEYALGNNDSTVPTTGWIPCPPNTVPVPTNSQKYLWNREVISYSSGSSTTTTAHIASMYAKNGTNGTDGRGISSISNQYAINNNSGTAPSSGWDDNPIPPTSSNPFLWNKEVITYTSGTPSSVTTTRVIGTYSEDGYNQATVYVYRRSSTPLDSDTYTPTATSYTFSTKELSNDLTQGWTQDMPPTGTDPCYISCAVVVSRENVATPITFATPAKLVQNGQDGQDGADGSTQVLLYLFKRSDAQSLNKPTTSSYNPTTGVLTASDSWVPDISDTTTTNPCWVTTTFLSISASTTGSISIPQNNWAEPVVLVKNGQDGQDGADGQDGTNGISITGVVEQYAINNSNTTPPAESSSDWSPTQIPPTSTYKYLWNREVISYSNGNSDITTPHIAGMYAKDGTNGTNGVDGKGISSVTNYYKTTTSATPVPSRTDSGWVPCPPNNMPTLDQTNKYLWNYECTTYTSGDPTYTTPHLIGMFSKDGQNGTSVTVSQTYYATSNNSSTEPTNWTPGSPTNISKGVWLWIKTEFSDNSNVVTCSYSGNDGKEISTITEYYAAYSRNDVAPTTGWNTNPSQAQLSSSNPYLWNYELITYSNNTTTETSKRVIGTYSADGKGISSVIDYYKRTTDTTPVPSRTDSGWDPSPTAPNQTYKCLWNYERTIYTDNTESYTSPHIVGMYGEKGNTGDKGDKGDTGAAGADGITVLTTSVKYAKGANSTTIPTPESAWKNTIIDTGVTTGDYLWTRTIVSYSDSNKDTTSYSVSRIGSDGAQGPQGIQGPAGADGTTIVSTGTKYAKSNSGTTAPTQSSDWKDTIAQTGITDGEYLWTRVIVSYTDSSKNNTSYTVSRMGVDGQDGQDGQDGRDGVDGKDANQYTIHTLVEEVLKFKTSTGFDFSASDLQMCGFDTKELMNIPNTATDGNDNPQKYIDINIELANQQTSYDFKEIFISTYYNQLIAKRGDPINYYFNLAKLYEDLQDQSTFVDNIIDNSGEGAPTPATIASDLASFFSNPEISLDIIIHGRVIDTDNSVSNIEKYISIKDGLSDEMLKFSINAGSINTAISNSKMTFDATGLTITNGGFRIKAIPAVGENEIKDVFYIDSTTNQLVMNGNGFFNGSGSFSGSITAASGVIGGFTIEENTLSTTGLRLESAHDGVTSSIDVDNIKLGTGANIKEYLNIGNLSLLNPSRSGEHDNSVLTLSNNNTDYFKLTDDGYIKGANWSIMKEEAGVDAPVVARFGNLIAENGSFSGTIYASDGRFSGEITASVINAATINTANFTSEVTRTMGGAFIFKPAFNILEIEPKGSNIVEFTLENSSNYFNLTIGQNEEYIVGISGFDSSSAISNTKFGKISSLTNASSGKIQVQFKSNDYTEFTGSDVIKKYKTLVLFGKATTNSVEGDLLIGINSDNNSDGNILPARALTMERFSGLTDDNIGAITCSLNLLLGDLKALGDSDQDFKDLGGYGLYADNVFLRGSLITKTNGGNTFAGVNTQRNINFSYNSWSGTGDDSNYSNNKIVFWGGASGSSDEAVKASPFIVTDQGNIFAKSGEFKGSVISDSVITQSVIKAPVIYGANDDSNTPSLKIYDTNTQRGGIGFYKLVGDVDQSSNGDDILTLNINNSGFIHYYNNQDTKFIDFNEYDSQHPETDSYIRFNGTSLTTGTTTYSSQQIVDNAAKINLANKIKLDYNTSTESEGSGIEILTGQVRNFGGQVINEGKTKLIDSNKYIEYRLNGSYYCLYVGES